jgi:hypothetical protein
MIWTAFLDDAQSSSCNTGASHTGRGASPMAKDGWQVAIQALFLSGHAPGNVFLLIVYPGDVLQTDRLGVHCKRASTETGSRYPRMLAAPSNEWHSTGSFFSFLVSGSAMMVAMTCISRRFAIFTDLYIYTMRCGVGLWSHFPLSYMSKTIEAICRQDILVFSSTCA